MLWNDTFQVIAIILSIWTGFGIVIYFGTRR